MDPIEIINELGVDIIRQSSTMVAIKNCPYCNDGKSKKPRGYFLIKNDISVYFCHNCIGDGESQKSLYNVCIDQGRPDLAVQLLKEKNTESNYSIDKKKNKISLNDYKINYLKKENFIIGKKRIKLKRLTTKDKSYLINIRKIDRNKLDNFYSSNFGIAILYRNKRGVYNLQVKNDGGYFFINNKITSSFELSNVYNLFNISLNAPLIILEGVIDTFFINNSVSIGGVSKWKTVEKILSLTNNNKVYFIQDNDEAGLNIAKRLISDEIFIFKWNEFINDYNLENYDIKDINDLYTNDIFNKTLSFMHLKKYFTNNNLEFNLYI